MENILDIKQRIKKPNTAITNKTKNEKLLIKQTVNTKKNRV